MGLKSRPSQTKLKKISETILGEKDISAYPRDTVRYGIPHIANVLVVLEGELLLSRSTAVEEVNETISLFIIHRCFKGNFSDFKLQS